MRSTGGLRGRPPLPDDFKRLKAPRAAHAGLIFTPAPAPADPGDDAAANPSPAASASDAEGAKPGAQDPGPASSASASATSAPAADAFGLEPPDFLDDVAKTEWRRVLPILEKADLVNGLDRAMLTKYAAAWSIYCRAVEATNGALIVKTAQGQVYRNPAIVILKAAAADMFMASARLGLSPVDRQRLKQAAPKKGPQTAIDPFEALAANMEAILDTSLVN